MGALRTISRPMKEFPVAVGATLFEGERALPFQHPALDGPLEERIERELSFWKPSSLPGRETNRPYGLSTGMPGEPAELMHPYPGGRAYTIAESR